MGDGGKGGGGVNLQPNFKKGVLKGPQFLDGACWKRVGDLFQGRGGEGLQFLHKK